MNDCGLKIRPLVNFLSRIKITLGTTIFYCIHVYLFKNKITNLSDDL